jgi:hypothetical protein
MFTKQISQNINKIVDDNYLVPKWDEIVIGGTTHTSGC